jgi:hypothetical protein
MGAAILLFNAALSLLVQSAAPAQPKLSDRDDYEYTGAHGLEPACPKTIYCYRVLVPVALQSIPADPERRWRIYAWSSHALTSTIIALTVSPVGSPWIASILTQTSYALTFTAYDPYTPDPTVFLIAALMLFCWMRDRAAPVVLIAAAGVFAKETVALLATASAIAVVIAIDRPRRWRWLVPCAAAWLLLLGFHWYMDTYRGWSITRNPAASFATGSWLAIWWRTNPSLIHKALIVFSAFGFGWVFAVAGYRRAPLSIRRLALGTILPIAALTYVQTPERALANAFYVVVPLATIFLASVSPAAAWAATIANALVTARIGLSTAWLPATTILMIPALLCAVWVLAESGRRHRISS